MNIDLTKVCDVEVDGIDTRDYPDFCDAFISEAWYKDTNGIRELTETELDWLNEQHDFVYEQVQKWLF